MDDIVSLTMSISLVNCGDDGEKYDRMAPCHFVKLGLSATHRVLLLPYTDCFSFSVPHRHTQPLPQVSTVMPQLITFFCSTPIMIFCWLVLLWFAGHSTFTSFT